MTPARFIQTRKPAWERLEQLLAQAGVRGANALAEKDLHELTRLYPAVAIDAARARLYKLDRSTQDPVTRTYHGTVRADGAGGLDTNLVMKQEEDPPSGHSPLWSGYTVAADGALEVTTPAGDLWVGGVSPSGRYAVFAGDTALGGEPVLFFLYQ